MFFWRCGGGRKDKTRKDFVAAASGFTIDEGRNSRSTSTIQYPRGHDDRVPSVELGDSDALQRVERQSGSQAPPPHPAQFATNRSSAKNRPQPSAQEVDLIPKGPELIKTASSNQQTSMPTLVTPGSEYYASGRGDHTGSYRQKWTDQSFSEHTPNLLVAENLGRLDSVGRAERHGWDDSRPVRPGGIDKMGSVDVQSARPDWLDETRRDIGDTESIGFGARKSGWCVRPGSAIDESVSGVDDMESVGFAAGQSSWLAQPGAVIDESISGIDDTESIGFGARRSSWLANPRSVIDESVSGIGDTESIGFGARKSNWLTKPGSVIDESASVQPSWMLEGETSQRPEFIDEAAAPPVESPLSGRVFPNNTRENSSGSHERTRGGQSSSEGAARPRSELADSPKESASRVTEQAPPGVRTSKGDGGESETGDKGGLLDLIMDTNEKEAIRRRNQREEKLRSTELARSAFLSCPPERIAKEPEDSSKQQTPRQGTAEVPPAQVKIVRSHTMPLSDRTDTVPPVPGRAKRPSTPSAPSRLREGDASPAPSTRRHVPTSKDGGRARERREKGPRDETIRAEREPDASADAGALHGTGRAKRFSPTMMQRTPLDGSPAHDSPSKNGRRVPSPTGDFRSRAPAPTTVRVSSPLLAPRNDERESSGSTPSKKPPRTRKRFDSSGSEDGASAGKDAVISGEVVVKGMQPSPLAKQRPTSGSTSGTPPSGTPPPQVVVPAGSAVRKARDLHRRKKRKPAKTKRRTEGCSPESSAAESRPGRSSESGSTSSADSNNNHSNAQSNGDRLPSEGRALGGIKVERVMASLDQSSTQPIANWKTPPEKDSSVSRPAVKTRTSENPAPDSSAIALGSALAGTRPVSNLTKPIIGRSSVRRPPFQYGTPRERMTRKQSRPRMQPDLPPVKEELGIPTSPINHARRPSDGPGFSLPSEDNSNHPRPRRAQDLAASRFVNEPGHAAEHGAITSPDWSVGGVSTTKQGAMVPAMTQPEPAIPSTRSAHPVGMQGQTVQGKTSTGSSDKDEVAKVWLDRRKQLPSGMQPRDDSFRRRGSQRFSWSSSLEDGSSSSFHGPQAMFSPGRFNPTSGALSWGGSVDDSWCESSVRSGMTAGTRHSSSASLLSVRGPSDRKLVSAPQLSKSEKQSVARLKIERSDVHFGYHTVGSSRRVFKIELNGEMRAAKVINMLGMNKEEMNEVLDTFDAELLALSRLSIPHIVKVYGASVSPAEIIVVSEFVERGALRDVLHDPRKAIHLTQRIRLGIAEDIASGMRSLYDHGMQHRHLSSNSVLLTSDFRAKIHGVGLTMTTELIGFFIGEERAEDEAEEELPWASREVLAGAGFSEKSDVYSFGIVLWEIMQKDPSLPYAGLLPSQVVGAKYNGEGPSIPEDCPPAISRLMKSCWSNLPADRPSFDKICDILGEIAR